MTMKTYVKNFLCYLVALFGLLGFISLFSSSLEIYDELKDSWMIFKVKAYVGTSSNGYKGNVFPIFGYILPLVCGLVLIIESFQPSWGKNIHLINTFMALIFFFSAVLVLLTKELFLSANKLGEFVNIRNGKGPIFCAVCSTVAGSLLLFVTYFPSQTKIEFIEK